MPWNDEELYQRLGPAAQAACQRAYCPYSNFRVGAALLCADGTILEGCNVENASYGLTICAERTAIVRAIAEGRSGDFAAIAVYAPDGTSPAAPCGACRQFLIEFNPEMRVLIIAFDGSLHKALSASDLLPLHFGPSSL